MNKTIIKICSVFIVATLIIGAAYLTGFDFGGVSKVFAANGYCYVYQRAQYRNQPWAYEDYTWTQSEEFIDDGQEAMTFEGVRIIDYHGTDTNVIVPDYINGKPVISVSNFISNSSCDRYESKKTIESVTLPSTLKEIGENAFKGMTSLKAINIPDNVEAINDYAFYGCTSLEEIIIPANVKTLNNHAFSGCTNLESVIFNEEDGKGLITTGDSTFENCTSLVSVELPDSLQMVDDCAFYNCSSLTDVVFNEGLYAICYRAFEKCNLQNVELKDGFINLGYHAFALNRNLKSISLPDSVEWIDTGFLSGTAVEELKLPKSLEEVGLTFLYNSKLKKIENPANSITVDSEYFCGANYLETLILEDTDIEKHGISFPTLKTLIYKGTGSIAEEPFDPYAWNPKPLYTYKSLGYYPDTVIFTDEINSNMDNFLINELGYYFRVDNETGYYVYEKPYGYDERYISSGVNCTDGEYKYYVTPDGGAVITEYTGSSGAVTVPEYFENEGTKHTVIGIGRRVFKDSGITEISLPSKLEMIGEYAFYETEITSVTFPDTMRYIEEYAFAKSKIKAVTVPGNVKKITEFCFSECAELKDIIFENGVEYILDDAFYNSSGPYNTISVPPSMIEISCYAFNYVASIDHFIFDAACYEYDLLNYNRRHPDENPDENYVVTLNYSGRFQYLFENGIIDDGDSENTTGVKINKFTVGTSVKYLPCNLLIYAEIGELSLPDNLLGIGEFAFCSCIIGCSSLVIPDSVKTIQRYAFDDANINELTLPEGLKYVSEDAFSGTAIETLNYNCKNCVFEDKYKTEIEGIYKSPFAYCENLKTINIGESVEVIPDFFFNSIPNLETVNFPDHIASLGKGAFAFSGIETINGLEELKNIEAIDDYTFYGCKNLTEFDMTGLNVTEIGDYAFATSGLVTFNGNDKLESIGDGCFEGCENLKTVNLGSNTETVSTSSFSFFRNTDFISNLSNIGSSAFANCTSLAEIEIPDSVKTIGEKAFHGDIALKNVEMSNNVTFVADECFNGCAELDTFVWNAESKHIGRLAFANCINLAEFDFVNLEKLYDNSFLNSGVTVAQLGEAKNESASELKEIEVQSFMDCESLATLGIGGNVTTIKTQAFANCQNLEFAFIADSVTEIAEDAFDGCDKLTIYCSENSYAHTYAQTQGIRVSTLVIAPIPNQTYTGFEIKPEISVSASGDTLDKNIDFSVSYANNVNVGNADVNVKGLGDFRMFASKAMFTIVTKNISAVTVSPIADQPYTGSAITPELTVTDGLKVLSEGEDYTVTFSNNVNEGTATAKITGIGNYSGTTTTDFVISKEAEEPSTFEKVVSFVVTFFRKVISFLVSIFM